MIRVRIETERGLTQGFEARCLAEAVDHVSDWQLLHVRRGEAEPEIRYYDHDGSEIGDDRVIAAGERGD